MTDGDLNAHPESFDEGWHREDRNAGGITAGTVVNWLVLILVLIAVGVLAAGAALGRTGIGFLDSLPRWWAEQVGDEVQGDYTTGSIYGLIIGSAFAFVPLLVLAQVRRKFFSWTWRFIVVLLAIVLALPNWLTIAVAVGTSLASQDGRIILTTEGPGFRNGSAIGAVVGLALGLIVVITSMRLGHQRRKVRELKARINELERHDGADVRPSAADADPEPEVARSEPEVAKPEPVIEPVAESDRNASE